MAQLFGKLLKITAMLSRERRSPRSRWPDSNFPLRPLLLNRVLGCDCGVECRAGEMGGRCSLSHSIWIAITLRRELSPPTDEANSYRFLPLLIIAGTIVLFAANGTGVIVDRFLESKVMICLGEVSFGLYLLHRPVMYLWLDVFGIRVHWTLTRMSSDEN
jgi:hypothetical protein